MNAISLDINCAKSYATRKNLMKALEKKGLLSLTIRFIPVKNEAGRWTAIFLVSEWCRNYEEGDVTVATREGFYSV